MSTKIKYVTRLNIPTTIFERLTTKDKRNVHIDGTELLVQNPETKELHRIDLTQFIDYTMISKDWLNFKTSDEREYKVQELVREQFILGMYQQRESRYERIYYILPLLGYGLTCVTCLIFDNTNYIKLATIAKKELARLLGPRKVLKDTYEKYPGLQNDIDWDTTENKAYTSFHNTYSVLGVSENATQLQLEVVGDEVVCYDILLSDSEPIKIDLGGVTQVADGALKGLVDYLLGFTRNIGHAPVLHNLDSMKLFSLKGASVYFEKHFEGLRTSLDLSIDLSNTPDDFLTDIMFQLCTLSRGKFPTTKVHINAEQFISLINAPIRLEELYSDTTQEVTVIREAIDYDATVTNTSRCSFTYKAEFTLSSVPTNEVVAYLLVYNDNMSEGYRINGLFIAKGLKESFDIDDYELLGLYTPTPTETDKIITEKQEKLLNEAGIYYINLADLYYRAPSGSILLNEKVKGTEIDTLTVIYSIRTTLINYYHQEKGDYYFDEYTTQVGAIWTRDGQRVIYHIQKLVKSF